MGWAETQREVVVWPDPDGSLSGDGRHSRKEPPNRPSPPVSSSYLTLKRRTFPFLPFFSYVRQFPPSSFIYRQTDIHSLSTPSTKTLYCLSKYSQVNLPSQAVQRNFSFQHAFLANLPIGSRRYYLCCLCLAYYLEERVQS